ncbi:hypothetical protein [Actinomadura sp. 21ATH]|uniref:hypothetical protein n=1 Tax=Actinomadura sp. 21ATH TaxID=1735444 RepID=UPI0035BEB5AA
MLEEDPVPPSLLSVAAPWDSTSLEWDPGHKPTLENVTKALDALEIALRLLADGWSVENPLGEGSGLPPRLLSSARWGVLLAAAMPTFKDITWSRLRETTSPSDRHWRAIFREELNDDQLSVLARLWVGDLLYDLMTCTSRWIRRPLRRSGNTRQVERAGELLTEYFVAVPQSRSSLLLLVNEGTGDRAAEFLRPLEGDVRIHPEERLWIELSRRMLQGESPARLPDFLWLMRGKQLVQIRQVFCLTDWHSPSPRAPLEINFEDGTAVQIGLFRSGMEFREGRDEFHWEAPQDYGLHYAPGDLYMVDRSDEPQVWPTIARELAEVAPFPPGGGGELTGVDFYFGDVLMAVREAGSREGQAPGEHWLDVSWSVVEPEEG